MIFFFLSPPPNAIKKTPHETSKAYFLFPLCSTSLCHCWHFCHFFSDRSLRFVGIKRSCIRRLLIAQCQLFMHLNTYLVRRVCIRCILVSFFHLLSGDVLKVKRLLLLLLLLLMLMNANAFYATSKESTKQCAKKWWCNRMHFECRRRCSVTAFECNEVNKRREKGVKVTIATA